MVEEILEIENGSSMFCLFSLGRFASSNEVYFVRISNLSKTSHASFLQHWPTGEAIPQSI